MSAFADFCEARSLLIERINALVDSGELSMDDVVEEIDGTKSVISQAAFIRLMARPARPVGRPVLRLVKS